MSGWTKFSRDHPRIRGEHSSGQRTCVIRTGSSPHTRGAQVVALVAQGDEVDHPRIRGEHEMRKETSVIERGSSPHTRGALVACYRALARLGIIPAYAGSTHMTSNGSHTSRDHPRIRGEHRHHDGTMYDGMGSSPHTRGARAFLAVALAPGGIIPAYAGSTKSA